MVDFIMDHEELYNKTIEKFNKQGKEGLPVRKIRQHL